MKKPSRIQLSRKKGWRMPANTIKVCRPGRWGNPFRVGSELLQLSGADEGKVILITQQIAVDFFRQLAYGDTPAGEATRAAARAELRGKNLACWCPLSEPCHADILLNLANLERPA